jgi:hypothetical protein
VEPVLLVTIVLLFASSVVVDGLVHAITNLVRWFDDLAHRPVTYPAHRVLRTPPARPAVLR